MPNLNQDKAAVIGWPVEHSLSPRLHGYWLSQYGLSGDYGRLAVEPQNLSATLGRLQKEGYRGVNLTVPHKEAVLAVLDSVEDVAQRIGAVNTVVVEDDGALTGYNTDIFGFAENLRAAGFEGASKRAVVLGAGGAARAVIAALRQMGCISVMLCNRTIGRSISVAEKLSTSDCQVIPVAWDKASLVLAEADLLVNTTTLGMRGQLPLEIVLDDLPQTAWVTDIVYTPLQTGLLRIAAERGHTVVDGLGMLLHQARPAFTKFFGIDPQVTPELRAHMLQALGE